jgi:acetate kinase
MKVLVVNCGSSSLRYQLIETATQEVLCRGHFERIGDPNGGEYAYFGREESGVENFVSADFSVAVRKMLETVVDKKRGAVDSLSEIEAVGHRTVHGGEIQASTVATDDTLAIVDKYTPLAPLHNPANLTGIRECMKALPGIPNVMVFDTAFHSTMPSSAFLYAIPMENYREHKIRRYGFHGTSHAFVSRKAAQMYGKPIEQLKIITAHLGNGASVCAVDSGKSVETSTGMTPVEGLIMGTRSGDVDAGVFEYLCKVHNFTPAQCIDYLNKKSGLLGLSGINNDMRDLMDKRDTDPAAMLAIDCFIHRLTKYIGAYAAVMGGVDIIAWTGGVGNNNEYIRERVSEKLKFLGVELDMEKNNRLNGRPGGKYLTEDISSKNARVRTYAVATNEELEIALETEKVLTK